MQQQQIDLQKAEEFAGQLFAFYTGGMVSLMIDIGHRTGLFEAAAKGPATSDELARRSGQTERYVREWLGALTTAGIFQYDRNARQYTLPPEHAVCLSGQTGFNLAPMSQFNAFLGKHVTKVADAFAKGGGVPYSEFRPEFTELMDQMNRSGYDENLLKAYIPIAPGLPERLERGISVADIGCGTGHCMNIMARAYPNSTFVGYDFAEDAVAAGNREARELGLSNVHFEVLDVAQLPPQPKFDLITAFDAIHDQAAPAAVLQRVSEALAPDGTFLMIDVKANSDVADNVGNPMAPMLYSVSVMHCMTVSLALNGTGLGTVWGEQVARQMLAEAGFSSVEVHDVNNPINAVYVCRK